ncbi:MAG: DUF177 domain-containing protein [Burkholderiales bacterium]|nr:DUF177 domain-containing protein [Burkholderiales bacterium]
MGKRPGTFDAFRLARDRGVLEGTLDVGASERLADRIAEGQETAARIAWCIEGTTDAAGRPALAIEITGDVPLTCQRCLTPLALPVSQRTVAVLAKSEADAEMLDADSEEEVLVADHPLDPAELVEDELLLTLPYAPMHEARDCPARHK